MLTWQDVTKVVKLKHTHCKVSLCK